MKKMLCILFPFIALMIAVGFIIGYSIYGPSDAQDAIFFIYVIILGLLGMLLFTEAGLLYLTIKNKKMLYYKILFVILAVINFCSSLMFFIFSVWPGLIIWAIILTGFIILKKANRTQNRIDPSKYV